jgi:hypothetical protein
MALPTVVLTVVVVGRNVPRMVLKTKDVTRDFSYAASFTCGESYDTYYYKFERATQCCVAFPSLYNRLIKIYPHTVHRPAHDRQAACEGHFAGVL